MKVVFFHRKPRPNHNFSVENLFTFVRKYLPAEVEWEINEAPYFSNGFVKRLLIGFDAAFSQKGINHITGDINFISLFLKPKYTVLTLLDLGLLNHPRPIIRWVLKMFWVVLPAKRAAVITTISKATKEELLKQVNINPGKVHVVYVPISEQFAPQPKKFNKNLPTILQIGTKSNKNVIRLVNALKGISCQLDIIGEIDSRLMQELLRNEIVFTHAKNLSNDEVFNKYQLADVISFVSTYEGFGMPIVEANAIGRVVVTSDLLSMPEVAGGAAHLVDPFDIDSIRSGIVRVIEDDDYREQLIELGFENVKRFEVTEIANQYASIYKSLGKE